MKFSITYISETDSIHIVVEGSLSLDGFNLLAEDVAKCLIKHPGCDRIINDLRLAKSPKSPVDTYYMPKCASKAGVFRSVRRAIIVKENQKDFRFLETVFINQGNIVQLFNNLEEARKWLFED
jgi:hypothetical protein